MKVFKGVDNIRIHIIFMFIVLFLLLAMFAFRNFIFRPSEILPEIFFTYPHSDTYMCLGDDDVTVGLSVDHYEEFNVGQGHITLSGVVSFDFDPKKVSLNEIADFDIDNGTILLKKANQIASIGDRVVASYAFKAELFQDFNYQDFPIEDHKLFISIINKNFSIQALKFKASSKAFVMNENLKPQGWRPINANVHTGYSQEKFLFGESEKIYAYPVITYEVQFLNPGIRNALVVLLPGFVLFFFSMYYLMIPYSERHPTFASIGAFSGLIIFRFVIDGLSPKVNYATFLDLTYIYFLIVSAIVFTLNIYQLIIAPGLMDTIRINNYLRIFLFYVLQIGLLIMVFSCIVL